MSHHDDSVGDAVQDDDADSGIVFTNGKVKIGATRKELYAVLACFLWLCREGYLG